MDNRLPKNPERLPSARRRLHFVAKVLGMLLIAAVGLELGSACLIYIETHKIFYKRVSVQAQRLASTVNGPRVRTKLHPFYGFHNVRSPEEMRAAGMVNNNLSLEQYHTVQDQLKDCCDFPTVRMANPDVYFVAILGNSIAQGVGEYLQIDKVVGEELNRALVPLGKRAVVFNLASGGHHPPQALMILAHVMATGMRFDLVVHFGTVQEVREAVFNLDKGLDPTAPADSVWGSMVDALEGQREGGAAIFFELALDAAASRLREDTAQCRFAACVVGLRVGARGLKSAAGLLRDLLPQEAATSHGRSRPADWRRDHYLTPTRPTYPIGADADRLAADTWLYSVEMLNQLTTFGGGKFLEIALPSPLEHDKSLKQDPSWGATVYGMKMLRTYMNTLRRNSVCAYDATHLFDGVVPEKSMYVDQHGHLSRKGMQSVVTYLRSRIVEDVVTSRICG